MSTDDHDTGNQDTGNARGRAVVDRIEAARFTPVRLRQGYDMSEVDALLDAVQQAATAGRRIRPLIDGATLRRVRLREGYAIDEVDRFLADLVLALP
ncbi:DivIVA domain-containing protein [Nocardioides aurantiacus]|uniref:DivIVA domain-containing protein n=1 Tax=Nocardioides aurantiacus TaxID=86796 RepID=A0A3N2CUZ1_9ACTN|nr:DivIVA domain-containing protein [Nocardioides aurantiacus]ROR91283.1 DivIVA domain-containing protein [Nocardioides aurantiacus]